MTWRQRNHVAERLIGDGADPTPADERHLAGCLDCGAVLRRRSAFDAQLRSVTRDLVPVLLGAEVLHAGPWPVGRRRTWPTLAAVPVAIALVAAIALGPPRDGAPSGASASPASTTEQTPPIRSLRIECGRLTRDECDLRTRPLRLFPADLGLLRSLGVLRGENPPPGGGLPVSLTFLSRTEVRIGWSDGTSTTERIELRPTIVVVPRPDE